MADSISTLSTSDLDRERTRSAHQLLDIRPIAAYNGWRLHNEPRGGHVPGAKSLPFAWTQYMDWVEVVEEKKLDPSLPTTIYGYEADEARAMADKLTRLGFTDLSVYDGFVDEWAPDEHRPLNRLARYRQLVYPEWVQTLIDGGTPPEYDTDRYVLCHAHFDYREDYDVGHLPGALPLNTNWLESTETWNRRSPEELERVLCDLGIRHDTTVVLYGRFSHPTYEQERPAQSAGQLAAMRCAALMLYAGVEDVKILNGGLNAWEAEGYALSTEEVEPEPVDDFGVEIPAHPEYMVDLPDAQRLLDGDDGELVSVRSWREFIGEWSGYHYIEKTGRIPGAVFGNCGSDAYHMENYRNFDYTTREFQEIAQAWTEGGIVPEKHIAFYCGTGWRGSEAFMNAYLMGWPHISVYDGGWFEWSSHPDLPTATGTPTERVVEPERKMA